MNRNVVALVAILLVVTGCINSIFTKYQDNQCVRNCDGPEPVLFEQPVLQTLQMFIGESSILFVYWIQSMRSVRGYEAIAGKDDTKPPLNGKKSLVVALPAICDICGTTLMNIALAMIPVSIYQMTRGVVILFVALFSVYFLKHKITNYEWVSLLLVIFGVVLVGYSGNSRNSGIEIDVELILGVALVILGQVCVATQFVIEEHVLSIWTMTPTMMVAYEGIYGSLITFASMVCMHIFVGAKNQDSPFNMIQAFGDMFSNYIVLYSSVVIMISIAGFNFFGLTITDNLNATARSTIDTCRTLLVWLVSLSIGWESFKSLQLTGFAVLVLGTLLFNGAIEIPKQYLPQWLANDYPTEHERVIDILETEVERF